MVSRKVRVVDPMALCEATVGTWRIRPNGGDSDKIDGGTWSSSCSFASRNKGGVRWREGALGEATLRAALAIG